MRPARFEVGKSADLVVLRENLFELPVEHLNEATVELTLFRGRPVFAAGDFEGLAPRERWGRRDTALGTRRSAGSPEPPVTVIRATPEHFAAHPRLERGARPGPGPLVAGATGAAGLAGFVPPRGRDCNRRSRRQRLREVPDKGQLTVLPYAARSPSHALTCNSTASRTSRNWKALLVVALGGGGVLEATSAGGCSRWGTRDTRARRARRR